MKSIIEAKFKHENHLCAVIFTTVGHRCGYVAVTADSPLYGKGSYDDLEKPELLKELEQTTIGKRGIIDVFCWEGKKTTPSIIFNVHGGITFAERGHYPIPTEEKLWWFGFDCAHYDDCPDLVAGEEYFGELWYLERLKYLYTARGVIRTKEYVIQECKSLAEQIACVEATY